MDCSKVTIRKEREEEWYQTEYMTKRAFWNLNMPGCDEHYLVHKVRSDANLTDSSKLKYFGILFGSLGVSSSSARLFSIKWSFVLRYFQNCRIETTFLALVPAEE